MANITMQLLNPRLQLKPMCLLVVLALAGCNSGEGRWPSSDDSDNSDSSDDDPAEVNFLTQDTTAGIEVTSGDFQLTSLATGNTRNEDKAGKIRQLVLTWESPFSNDSSDVSYTICQADDSQTDRCTLLAVVTDELSHTQPLDSLLDAANQGYFVIANHGSTTAISSEKTIHPGELGKMAGYFKASNTGYTDDFGRGVALSGDGYTIVSTAPFEDSAGTGINGDQVDDTYNSGASGAAYVFTYDQTTGLWSQTAYLKTMYPERMDYFGYAVAISEDGQTIAVGAYGEDSGIVDDETDNSASYAGAVYIYSFDGSAWTQTAYLKDAMPEEDDRFGYALSMSSNGSRLAVGAPYQNAEFGDSSIANNGAVLVFDYDGLTWSQVAFLEASNKGEEDKFGQHVALSGDGNTLAVGAYLEDSADIGVNSDGADDNAENAGAVYIFSYNESTWSQSAYLKASNTEKEDYFGYAIALDEDGTTLAVGAAYEDSAAIGINGAEDDNSGKGAGAVYLFELAAGQWSQSSFIKGANTEGASGSNVSDSARDPDDDYWGDHFGHSVAFSKDGKTLAVGTTYEDSAAIGINWDESDDSIQDSGAVYMFVFADDSSSWSQTAYVKAANTGDGDSFGQRIALSSDGDVLVVGANNESSAATGINGEDTEQDDDDDNEENFSGALYVY